MKYLRMTYPDLANGNGCRITLWLPGCSHNCPGCHNEWTHKYNQGKDFNKEEFDKLVNFLNKDYVDGLTLSGGDPLDQSDEILDELYQLLQNLKQTVDKEFNIWIYTGYYKRELVRESQQKILNICDYLVDGPYIEKFRNIMLPFRGSSNQHIWDLKSDCIADEVIKNKNTININI